MPRSSPSTKHINMYPRILAIETSCDETALALIKTSPGGRSFCVLSNIVLSQVALHTEWGGVVPNLAKREHQRNLVPLLLQSIHKAHTKDVRFKIDDLRKGRQKKNLTSKILHLKSILEREPELLEQFIKHLLPLPKPPINLIAVTKGPGLEPALWVGVNFARALSTLWDIPLVGINHMEGHIFSALIEQRRISNSQFSISKQNSNYKTKIPKQKLLTARYSLQTISYPAIALLVSGGHTELVLIKKPLHYKIIGETRDDAAGEAFDKVARILGLRYPGGPQISAEAQRKTGDTSLGRPVSKLPRPMINSKDFDFSFSGLKTAVLYLVRDLEKQGADIKKLRPVIANEFQDAVVDVLVAKTIRAAKEYKAKTVLLGGGVAANNLLQERLAEEIERTVPLTTYYVPLTAVTGDNALMIAAAAIHRATQAKKQEWKTIKPEPQWQLAKQGARRYNSGKKGVSLGNRNY